MTPHNEAKLEDIANVVLMPGDPLRAKYIAENFLVNTKLVNSVRGMYAYTGEYKGKRITVMAHGMGNGSIGIYSYELYKFYNVDKIIRIGSCGAYAEGLNLLDVILVDNVFSEGAYAKLQNGSEDKIIPATRKLNDKILETAHESNINVTVGTVHNTEVFYSDVSDFKELRDKYGCLAVEMESFALFHNAKVLNKEAACLLSVTDSFLYKENLSPEDRQKALNDMIVLALNTTLKL